MPTRYLRYFSIPVAIVAVLDASAPRGLQAQTELICQCRTEPAFASRRALVLQGGAWLVDLDGTVVAARAELPVGQNSRWLFIPALTFAHGYLRTAAQTDVLVPEAHLHYQLARGRYRPYVGGGAGLSFVNLLDRTINTVVTVASGLRADLGPRWGARVEADLRLFSGLRAGSVGWSVGVARTL